jgi:hypothetical protein
MAASDGKGVRHAELRIGDSVLMLNVEAPEIGSEDPQAEEHRSASYASLDDVDGVFRYAVDTGAKHRMPPTDAFLAPPICPGRGSVSPPLEPRNPRRGRFSGPDGDPQPRVAGEDGFAKTLPSSIRAIS